MTRTVRSSTWNDPFTSVVRQLDRDFDAVLRRSFGVRNPASAGVVPAANVVREGADIVISLDLPGIDSSSNLDVEVADGRLVISGERVVPDTSPEDSIVIREVRSGAFRREFALPDGVGADQLAADYDNGVLTVRVREAVKTPQGPTKVAVRGVVSRPEVSQSEVSHPEMSQPEVVETGAEQTDSAER